jgi:D-beta-D-heptose 7-phosphate kinase/D-beta-D-heptose 1-phosphate adenosyltransferase
MKKKAIIVSGYFNPIHKGHLEYFHNAKAISEELFVIVNSDFQRKLKGSKEFQDEEERMIIVSQIKNVNKAILSVDQDRTVCETIKKLLKILDMITNFHLPMAEIKIITQFLKNQFVKN